MALTLAAAVIAVADGDLFILALVPAPIGPAVMGSLVAARRPGHPMGTLLCAYALAGALSEGTFAYARAAVVHFPHALPFAVPVMWITNWDYVPAVVTGAFVLPLLFPDGHLPSPRWRPVMWMVTVFVVLLTAGNAFGPQNMGGWFDDVPNPYTVEGPLFGVMLNVAGSLGLAVVVATVASVVTRWRRAGHVVRQQLKWFLATAPLIVAVATFVQFFPDALMQGLILGAVANPLTTAAIGLAVLRYRLYNIDVLLSRAAVYGVLTVFVAGLYLAVVALAGGSFSASSGLDIQVLATVIAAGVLLPVRGRLQRRVDRVFFGDRGSPYIAMARLGRQVEEATTAEPVLSSVATVVASSLRLPYAAVQLRIRDDWVPSASWGEPTAELVSFPLTFQRETVGRLLVGQRAPRERLSQEDERLLANLARQVAPAAHAVALRQALDASRTGQVTAREEERRRLRRDLHDGLGPTIAGLMLGLETACAMSGGQAGLTELLGGLKEESQRAIGDVRRIVYGLRPPALDEAGLAEALREEIGRLARQAPSLSIALQIPGRGLGELPAAVEVAAYRIVIESVTNVLRHAGARRCEIRILTGADLTLEIRDDGAGMAEGWRAGVGITVMRERVAELGGELVIEPGAARGTRIGVRLPGGVPA